MLIAAALCLRAVACSPRLPRFVLVALFWVLAGSLGRAHDPGISTSQGEVRAGVLTLTTGFAPADVQELLPREMRHEGTWTQDEFETARVALEALAPQLWEVRQGDSLVAPRRSRVELLPGDNVSFHHEFPFRAAAEKLTLRAVKVPSLPDGHRQFVIVADENGSTLSKKLLSARDPVLEVVVQPGAAPGEALATPQADAPSAPAAPLVSERGDTTFAGFLKLGVEHIWTGYDHLLFLFALLIVCRSFRSIVAIVSCFTLAHSITLAAATLDWVSLPSRWVEAAIAASIVYVGAENLWRRGEEPKGRWLLTFGFGLVHGFGFAGVLRDLGVGRSQEGILLPLFSFNLGVELGQILIAAVLLPLVWWLRKREGFVRRGVPALSAIVVLAGLYWLIERTVLA